MAVERESVKWEVGPTKDVVGAFMETLVGPELPYDYECSANEPPSQDLQKSIARQMHAVVLLYNYYHRKQKPDLEFLDFESFCKLALSLSPKMTSFMKMFRGNEDQLSVTEKAIQNACDISMSLDASKDVPTTQGFSISKVAVLLIDSENENFLLQFGAVTKGAWSLIEKEINELSINQEALAEERACKKRKTSDHTQLLEIGFDAVKDVAGIEVSELVVLEAHVVYSLSKEKSATQLYMMKCKQSFSISQRFSVESLLESLQGPFAEKFSGAWSTTTLIEYYLLLPYKELISSWFSRKDSCVPNFSDYIPQSIKSRDKNEISPSRKPKSYFAEYTVEDFDHINPNTNGTVNKTKTSSPDKVANEDSKDSQKKSKCGKVDGTEKYWLDTTDPKTRSNIVNSCNKRTTRSSSVNVDKDGEAPGKASLCGYSQSVDASTRMHTSGYSEMPFTRKRKNNMRSEIISSAQDDANGPEDGVNTKADILKSNEGRRNRDEGLTAEIGDPDIASKQNGIAGAENAVIHFTEVGNVTEDLQNAFALLDRKRQELYSRLCDMEDTLALYENLIDRVRDGGEVDLARQCIESLVSGRDNLLLKNEVQVQGSSQPEKQTKFSNTFLPGRSSCQDLEYTCLKNSWRMPRYFIQPSDGKFLVCVVLYCTGSTLSSKGGAESSPREARESAAAQMIKKIRALVMEAQ